MPRTNVVLSGSRVAVGVSERCRTAMLLFIEHLMWSWGFSKGFLYMYSISSNPFHCRDYNLQFIDWVQWLTPEIPATQEVDIQRFAVGGPHLETL
jgi:hypothetical protein